MRKYRESYEGIEKIRLKAHEPRAASGHHYVTQTAETILDHGGSADYSRWFTYSGDELATGLKAIHLTVEGGD
jgi:hypothetical protein